MNPFVIAKELFCYLVALYNKKYRSYRKTVRTQKEWVLDVRRREYVLVVSKVKFRKHISTHKEERYYDQGFVDSHGVIHNKGWYPAEEYQQQGSHFRY